MHSFDPKISDLNQKISDLNQNMLIQHDLDHIQDLKYIQSLNQVLVEQSRNNLFFQGKVSEGAKVLTKQVANIVNTDRCSLWLFNLDRTSIKCEQLYIKADNEWYQGFELYKKDYEPYFNALNENPIIVADIAETHYATSCFTESYLNLYGIKSMLDVPIFYQANLIGVICIESLTYRNWSGFEIDFLQILSSFFSFAYSVKEETKEWKYGFFDQVKKINEFEKFADESTIITKADANGKITYVNRKFTEVSEYELDEVVGKDHNIVNSGIHPKELWADMYKTVIKERKIWNSIITNKTKSGKLYYVDTFIKAEFENEQLTGFISMRQDVTKIYETLNAIDEKNVYLEHAAKILRHDMHSGINTYIPRGLSSLERRLTPDMIEQLKIESPLKMIREGLKHAQKVYRGVYEFTNLVKPDSKLNKTNLDLKDILTTYLASTSYSSQVIIEPLVRADVNESLFCTAIDNLIRNGLKYNDSDTKFVRIYMDENTLCIQDNGRGMTQEEFEKLSQPYVRKENQKETGSGLGLNICISILKEHQFNITCEKNNIGTKLMIQL